MSCEAVRLLNVNGFYDPLLAMFDRALSEGFLRPPYGAELVLTGQRPRRTARGDAGLAPACPGKVAHAETA